MSGTCEHCHRRRPQVYVHVKKRRLYVCPNCASILIKEAGAKPDKPADAEEA